MCITYCDITGIQHAKVLCTLGSLYVKMHSFHKLTDHFQGSARLRTCVLFLLATPLRQDHTLHASCHPMLGSRKKYGMVPEYINKYMYNFCSFVKLSSILCSQTPPAAIHRIAVLLPLNAEVELATSEGMHDSPLTIKSHTDINHLLPLTSTDSVR